MKKIVLNRFNAQEETWAAISLRNLENAGFLWFKGAAKVTIVARLLHGALFA